MHLLHVLAWEYLFLKALNSKVATLSAIQKTYLSEACKKCPKGTFMAGVGAHICDESLGSSFWAWRLRDLGIRDLGVQGLGA